MDRGRVVVVLVLRRLLRLGLDEQHALEADLGLVLGHQVEEAGQLGALPTQVGVQQGVVALSAAPQDVVRAAESLRDLEHVADLGRGVGEDLGVGVGRCATLVARVGEQVGGAPQEPQSGALLVPQRVVGERVQVGAELAEGGAFGSHIHVMEAVVGHAQLVEELEGNGHLQARGVHRVHRWVEPRAVQGPDAEHVATIPGERVPQAHADAQLVLHALAQDQAIGVVHLEGQRVVRAEARERIRPGTLSKNCSLMSGPPLDDDGPAGPTEPKSVRRRSTALLQGRHACKSDRVT